MEIKFDVLMLVVNELVVQKLELGMIILFFILVTYTCTMQIIIVTE